MALDDGSLRGRLLSESSTRAFGALRDRANSSLARIRVVAGAAFCLIAAGLALPGGDPLPASDVKASLVRGRQRFFLVYKNYETILDYNCSNAYAKGKRFFEVLGKLDPATLAQHLPSFVRLQRILRSKL